MIKHFFLVLILLLSTLCYSEEIKLKATIKRAIDGDTFIISIEGNKTYNESIRLA